MPFIRIDGIEGKLFVPGDEAEAVKKNRCKDCHFCQFCNDEKCSACIKNRCCKQKEAPPVN